MDEAPLIYTPSLNNQIMGLINAPFGEGGREAEGRGINGFPIPDRVTKR
jgi:hypothetical protein